MTLRKGKERILSFDGGSSRSHYVESSIWKRLWTCRKTDYQMNELPATRLDEPQGRYGRCGGNNSVCWQSNPDCIVVGIFALPRYYAPHVGSLLPTFREEPIRSHPQRPSTSVDGTDRLYRETVRLLTSPLKMEVIGRPETSGD